MEYLYTTEEQRKAYAEVNMLQHCSFLTKFHMPYSINPYLACPKCKPASCKGHSPVNHYGVIMFDWQAALWNLFAYCQTMMEDN